MTDSNSVILFLTKTLLKSTNDSFFIDPNRTQKPSGSGFQCQLDYLIP